ncbi:MAG: flagellin, partial [Acidimicrobiia bacterium]
TPPAGGTFSITALNGSFAGSDLGILGQSTGAIMIGSDRATVAVNSVFSHLIDLRDSLRANNELGITLAGGALDGDINRLAEARAHMGVLSRRVTATTVREEDLRIQDMSLRSQYQDLDFTEAAIRFSQLQQQLQAGLLTTSQVTSLSLLDFLS